MTQAQWIAVMGSNPSEFSSCGGNCPVESVSWNDVQEFIARLNAATGRQYRLPTEAEWEYAARAGTIGAYAGSNIAEEMGWYGSNAGQRTHPVAQKAPNAWGLYDMHGNVAEWVQDLDDGADYSASGATDPTGPSNGSSRGLRGGSFSASVENARSAARWSFLPYYGFSTFGFRLARTP